MDSCSSWDFTSEFRSSSAVSKASYNYYFYFWNSKKVWKKLVTILYFWNFVWKIGFLKSVFFRKKVPLKRNPPYEQSKAELFFKKKKLSQKPLVIGAPCIMIITLYFRSSFLSNLIVSVLSFCFDSTFCSMSRTELEKTTNFEFYRISRIWNIFRFSRILWNFSKLFWIFFMFWISLHFLEHHRKIKTIWKYLKTPRNP